MRKQHIKHISVQSSLFTRRIQFTEFFGQQIQINNFKTDSQNRFQSNVVMTVISTRSTWCFSQSRGNHRSRRETPLLNLDHQTQPSQVRCADLEDCCPAERPYNETERECLILSWCNNSSLVHVSTEITLTEQDLTLLTDVSSTRHSSMDSSREFPEVSIFMW